MENEHKFRSLASIIVAESRMAQDAICMLVSINSSAYLFFSGVFVAISGDMALRSIDLTYTRENLAYIVLHFVLVALSLTATLILMHVADLSQKIDKSIALEHGRLIFDASKASDKKNEFENSLKEAFNISDDEHNAKLSHVLKRTYILRGICIAIAPTCLLLIAALTILKNDFKAFLELFM